MKKIYQLLLSVILLVGGLGSVLAAPTYVSQFGGFGDTTCPFKDYSNNCGGPKSTPSSIPNTSQNGSSDDLLSGVSLLESAACPFKDYDYLVAFTDIKRSPYKTYIDTLREQCIATATQGTNFSPDTLMTEGEFIKWMVKYYALLYGYEDELTNIKGTSTTSYYAKAKEWGIIKESYKAQPTSFVKGGFMESTLLTMDLEMSMSNTFYTRGEVAMILFIAIDSN